MAWQTEQKNEALCSIFMRICPSWWHANWLARAQEEEAQVSCCSHSASCLLWWEKGKEWMETHCSAQDGSLLGTQPNGVFSGNLSKSIYGVLTSIVLFCTLNWSCVTCSVSGLETLEIFAFHSNDLVELHFIGMRALKSGYPWARVLVILMLHFHLSWRSDAYVQILLVLLKSGLRQFNLLWLCIGWTVSIRNFICWIVGQMHILEYFQPLRRNKGEGYLAGRMLKRLLWEENLLIIWWNPQALLWFRRAVLWPVSTLVGSQHLKTTLTLALGPHLLVEDREPKGSGISWLGCGLAESRCGKVTKSV